MTMHEPISAAALAQHIAHKSWARVTRTMTLEQRVARILAELAPIPTERLMARDIITASARVFGVSVKDIIGQSRFPEHVVPRQIGMAVAHVLLSGTRRGTRCGIGRVFKRDRSSILCAIEKYAAMVGRIYS